MADNVGKPVTHKLDGVRRDYSFEAANEVAVGRSGKESDYAGQENE